MPICTPPAVSRIASLETIDFGRLLEKDRAEESKLLSLCIKDGFFYLDLQNPSIIQILAEKERIVRMMEAYFALPLDEKMNDDRQTRTLGYKPAGTETGCKEGSRDCFEMLKISYQEMTTRSELLPSAVKEKQSLFDSFFNLCQFATKTILISLSDILGLQGNSSFEAHHRDDKPSKTVLGLLHYPKQDVDEGMGHVKHTDIGSLTLLFTFQWGLQLQQPSSDKWAFVAPREGCAVVNVGDSLRFLSEKKFNSCLHRVIPVASNEERYSMAYFLRPENETEFEDMNGNKVKAAQWYDDKNIMFAETHDKQKRSDILTGGMERKGGRVLN